MSQVAPTLTSVIASVRPLIEAGASLHWLVPFEKRPFDEKWTSAPRLDLDGLKKTYPADANIGVRLGEPSKIGDYYLLLLDIDVRKPECEASAWAEVLRMFPKARSYPSVISGSGGASRHIYILTEKPFRKRNLAKSDGFEMVWNERKQKDEKKRDWMIDLYGTGVQAVLPPSIHPDTGLPYVWERPLELDMLEFDIGPIVPSSQIEALGARAAEAADTSSDDDDLEMLFSGGPLDLSDEEVERTLADLPSDWVDDYWMWVDVGMALHHQYEGSDKGFSLWCEWSSGYDRYTERACRDKWPTLAWKSRYKGDFPKTFRSMIQAANANRMAQDHDFEVDDFDSVPATVAGVDPYSLDDLLGDAPALPVTIVVPAPARPTEPEKDWQLLLARGEDDNLKSNLHNVFLLMDCDPRTFMSKEFNEFRQERVFRQPPRRLKKKRETSKPVVNLDGPHWTVKDPINGDTFTDTHISDIRRFMEAPTTQGGYGIKVSDRDLIAGLELAARKNSFHPIREVLMSLKWDGVKRMDTIFIDYLGCPDDAYHRQVARLFLLGAVTRVFQPGHKFDFVPILEGTQGKGKTTFIEILALEWYRELTGDISDPQHVVGALKGAWILELGELSAMQRQEVNDLKAFVTRRVDTARMPYERTMREFPRQCVFMGSTNDDTYLRDQTGGRRFWPVKCAVEGQIDNKKLRGEITQIWAEVVHVYHELCQGRHAELDLQLADDAISQALALQDSRRVESPEDILAGQIEAWLNTPISNDDFDDLDADATKVYRNETCTAQIWQEMLGRTGTIPHMETMKIGKAMSIIGWPRTQNSTTAQDINKKYGRCRVYNRPE